jgi:hypothetical protein
MLSNRPRPLCRAYRQRCAQSRDPVRDFLVRLMQIAGMPSMKNGKLSEAVTMRSFRVSG